MNQLSCQSCGSALQVDGFDRRLAVVHCSHCGVLFDLTKPRNAIDNDDPIAQATTSLRASENLGDASGREAISRPVAAMPPGFSISGGEQLTVVRWSWRSASSVFFLGFAVLWNLILLVQFGVDGLNLFRGMFMLFGFFMLYRGVAGILNNTTITADENWLRVRHSPLPWYPAPKIDSSSIEQLFVSEGFTQSKKGRKTPYYLLNAVLRDNTLKRLSNKLPDIEPALYLEQEFERVLRIRDRAVAGEVRGTTRHV